jgi:hypothetical protein
VLFTIKEFSSRKSKYKSNAVNLRYGKSTITLLHSLVSLVVGTSFRVFGRKEVFRLLLLLVSNARRFSEGRKKRKREHKFILFVSTRSITTTAIKFKFRTRFCLLCQQFPRWCYANPLFYDQINFFFPLMLLSINVQSSVDTWPRYSLIIKNSDLISNRAP